jgi:hypothetical protein
VGKLLYFGIFIRNYHLMPTLQNLGDFSADAVEVAKGDSGGQSVRDCTMWVWWALIFLFT